MTDGHIQTHFEMSFQVDEVNRAESAQTYIEVTGPRFRRQTKVKKCDVE